LPKDYVVLASLAEEAEIGLSEFCRQTPRFAPRPRERRGAPGARASPGSRGRGRGATWARRERKARRREPGVQPRRTANRRGPFSLARYRVGTLTPPVRRSHIERWPWRAPKHHSPQGLVHHKIIMSFLIYSSDFIGRMSSECPLLFARGGAEMKVWTVVLITLFAISVWDPRHELVVRVRRTRVPPTSFASSSTCAPQKRGSRVHTQRC